MRIALDYDGTYTRDPGFWQAFIQAAIAAGHDVRVVTKRAMDLSVQVDCRVIYTDMQPKGQFCAAMGWAPHIWIDDHPERIWTDV